MKQSMKSIKWLKEHRDPTLGVVMGFIQPHAHVDTRPPGGIVIVFSNSHQITMPEKHPKNIQKPIKTHLQLTEQDICFI